MITGFNHNIKHKGRLYHVQTEDSGLKNPHIITHLFVGGNILASKKTEYRELLGSADYEKKVRAMMEEQHKQMLRNLVNGAFDGVSTGTAYQLDGPAPLNLARPSPPPPPAAAAASPPSLAASVPSSTSAKAQAQAQAQAPAATSSAATALHDETGHRAASDVAPRSTEVKPQAPTSLFGESLISERSLDEVILNYLEDNE